MELTEEQKAKMTDFERDKSYIPGQEKLPVVAYQIIKQLIGFIVQQNMRIKELERTERKVCTCFHCRGIGSWK